MILCSGCFDGLHAGHVRYLQAAYDRRVESLPHHYGGEGLVVALASDAYIRRVKRREPRWSYAERMETLLALVMVDEVVEHSEVGVADVILATRPRVFVKGHDWMGGLRDDVRDACEAVGAQIVFVNTPAKHTSEAFA